MILLAFHFLIGIGAAAYWVLKTRKAGWSLAGQIAAGVLSWLGGYLSGIVALIDFLVNEAG